MRNDPLLERLNEIIEQLALTSEDNSSTEILENPLKHHVEPSNQPAVMYETLASKLCKENS